MDNWSIYLNTTVRISQQDVMSSDAIWPKNIEVCISRVPIRLSDGWDADKIKRFAAKLKDHMVPNGIIFLICYAPTEAKFRPFEVAKSMVDAGFTHIDNIIIKKSWFPGKRSEINLVNSHEYVLHFCNGNVWQLDRLPIRNYLKTEDVISCPGNTWEIETGSLDEAYPVDLAELLIRMTNCLPGSVIFEPFGGSSNALKIALKLGHTYYGFETNQKQLKKNEKIITDFNSQLKKKQI